MSVCLRYRHKNKEFQLSPKTKFVVFCMVSETSNLPERKATSTAELQKKSLHTVYNTG